MASSCWTQSPLRILHMMAYLQELPQMGYALQTLEASQKLLIMAIISHLLQFLRVTNG